MPHRGAAHLVAIGLALAAALATGSTVPAQADTARPEVDMDVTSAFSPNGDGVKDEATVRYTLKRASAEVMLTVRTRSDSPRTVLKRRLGAQDRGRYTWTWDGRGPNGKRVTDGLYNVVLTAEYLGIDATEVRQVVLDTSFHAGAAVQRYGAPRSVPTKVYPRSTEVVDALPITATAERRLKQAHLTIKDGTGRVVLTRDVMTGQKDFYGWRRHVDWKARRGGEPLPVGRYRAFVTGVDKAGNAGRSGPVKIYVSADRLVWKEETRTLTAAGSQVTNACGRIYTGNDCPLTYYCGAVVPSTAFVGGHSHRSAFCPPERGGPASSWSRAVSVHLLEVPEAVRGIDRGRVAFTGAPAYPGESDPGTLSIGGTATTSATGDQSPWDEDPAFGMGRQPFNFEEERIAPSAFWTFETAGDDAFDVASFTVDLRYLVVG